MAKPLALASVLMLAAVIAVALWSDRSLTRSNSRAAAERHAGGVTSNLQVDTAPDEEPARLFGRVVDQETGNPVADASVVAYDFGTGRTLETTSAADGGFSLWRALGTGDAFQLVARRAGFGTASVRAIAPRDAILVRLPAAGGIRGRIVSAENKSPVSPCRVAAFRLILGEQPWDHHGSVLSPMLPAELVLDAEEETRADGTFEMEGLAPGPYALLVQPEGLAPTYERVGVQAHVAAEREIAVPCTAELPVDVFDEETGRPLDGVQFEVETGNGWSSWSALAPPAVLERGPGTYGLQAGFRSGSFDWMWLRVSRAGYARRILLSCRFDAFTAFQSFGEGDRFRIALGRGATIDGHVRASGKPVQGAFVLVSPAWGRTAIAAATTDSTGAFEIRGIDVGEGLDVLVYDRTLHPISAVGLVLGNGERRTIEIGADVATAIEGRVVLGGAPAAGRIVKLTGATAVGTATDRDGAFRFECLSPGRHQLRVDASGGYITRCIEVAEGQRARLDIEAASTICGVVIDSMSGSPVTDVSWLGVVANGPGSEDSASTYAGEGGRFRLAVDPGVYRIDSQSDDVLAVETPVVDTTRRAAPDVVLRVSRRLRGCSLTLDVRDGHTNERVKDCVYDCAFGIGHTRGSKSHASEPVTIPDLSPGLYRICIWSDVHVPAEIEVLLQDERQETREVVWLLRAEAVRVAKVARDSEAARAGLRAGDTILACNGVPTPSLAAFNAANTAEGTATIEYQREGEHRVARIPKADMGIRFENSLLDR